MQLSNIIDIKDVATVKQLETTVNSYSETNQK